MSRISSSGLSFSGLASGMDTDAMVEAMVSGYKTKYDNEQKEKLLLDLKLEKYREVNTKVVDFYDDYLRKLRLESTFSASTTSSSNPDAVQINSGGNTGDQITITQLAKPITVSTSKIQNNIEGLDTKLTDLGFSIMDGIKFTASDGSTKTIEFSTVSKDGTLNNKISTVGDLVDEFVDEGINISFDEESGMFDLSNFINGDGNAPYQISAISLTEQDDGSFKYEDVIDDPSSTTFDEGKFATDALLSKMGMEGKSEWSVQERASAKNATLSPSLNGTTLWIGNQAMDLGAGVTVQSLIDGFGLEVDENGMIDMAGQGAIRLEKTGAPAGTPPDLSYNEMEKALSNLGLEDGYILESSKYVSKEVGMDEITGETTMHDLGVSGSLKIAVDGQSHVIHLSENKTIDDITEELNKTGLNVKFHADQGAFNITTDAKSLTIEESKSGTLKKLGINPPPREPYDEDTTLVELGFKIGDTVTIDTGGELRSFVVSEHNMGGQQGIFTLGELSQQGGLFRFNEDDGSIDLAYNIDHIEIRSADQSENGATDEEIGKYTLDRLKDLGISVTTNEDGTHEYESNPIGEGRFEYEAVKAKGTYNGMEIESDTNTFKLDGISFTAKKVTDDPTTTEVEEIVTIDKTMDEEALFTTVSDFVNAYNTLIDDLTGYTEVSYDPTKDSGYKPLLPEEKEAMSDSDIELWEEKVDSLLLRDDPEIERLLDSLRYNFMEVFPDNESFKSLAEIGITTSLDYTQRGRLELDEEKLRAAISKDAEGIKTLFVGDSTKGTDGYAEKMYDSVTDLLKSSSSSSSMFLFNDIELEKAISDQQDDIDEAYDQMTSKEELYQAQFLAMEMAIQEMNSQMNLFNQGGMGMY
ncbi:MAG: hypothetical protein ATN31_03255 [Candidatus Epulonipiscioides saccharophilum]|nr:MAG: hypothetical protein ATN31_03255 [Epulopiscium sp. AS2M-Bin001]